MGYYTRLKQKATDKWSKSYASSYWYDDYERSFDYYDRYTDWGYKKDEVQIMKKSANLYKLASVRRAIANFVQIVTGKKIPVTFATKSDSKTDGERVILSADVDDNFDVSVGLALHEGSHIVLSDFKMLREFSDSKMAYSVLDHKGEADNVTKFQSNPRFDGGAYSKQKYAMFHPNGKIRTRAKLTEELYQFIMNLSNWIEDRRIDSWIYKTAPGYRDYYVSMYEHYFNDKIVTKGIDSDEFTDETIDSYLFRIVNLLNEKTSLSKLKGLRTIAQMLDLKNISRLKSSADSLSLAIDVTAEMLKYTKPADGQKVKGEDEDGEGDGEGGDGETIDDLDGYDVVESDGDAKGKQVRLSPKALEQLKKKIQKQKEFLNGKIKKKYVSKTELKSLENIEESDTELTKVGMKLNEDGRIVGKGVDCIVVKRLTDNMIESSDFPCSTRGYDGAIHKKYEAEVQRGIQLGTLLGKKLQVRAESRETIFSRLKSGRIDKRMIASLGYDNESVFFNHHIDQYKKVNLHISIDYSGSMQGEKMRRTVTAVVAIAKACIMARNIDVQISIRTTSGSPELPWVCMVYNSRYDSLKKLCKYMSFLRPHGTTPEGLCFEAIQKYLIPQSNDMDSYFLNFSDGQPCFSISNGENQLSYGGNTAAVHTREQVKRMGEMGIQVLSYFITDIRSSRFESSEDWDIFKRSYSDGAKFVNVENMFEVAKTMNEMFLKK